MDSPSTSSICGLDVTEWMSYVELELSSLRDEVDIADRTLYLCMRLAASLGTQTRNEVKNRAFLLCGKLNMNMSASFN